MLALEPSAILFTSAGTSTGAEETAPYSVGEFEFDTFASHPLVWDYFMPSKERNKRTFTTKSEVQLLTALPDFWNSISQLIRDDPNDPTAFQILQKMHVVYPAEKNDSSKLAGRRRFPLVVMLHGQHTEVIDNEHYPNHRGYTYLQRELAAWGIICVSLNTNIANVCESLVEMRAQSVLKALDSLWTLANTDSSSRLYKRIDFNRVGLAGHSRGGDAVVRAAIINSDPSARNKAKIERAYKIQAVCSLAPTDQTGTTTPAPPPPPPPLSNPTASVLMTDRSDLVSTQAPFFAVLYGALDGDVAGADDHDHYGTGFRLYDRAETEKAMIFFERCNHNRFSDVWTQDDTHPSRQGDLLSRADHRTLAKEYIGGLFRWRLLGKARLKRLFNGTARNSIKADCSIQWSFGPRLELDDMEGPPANSAIRSVPGGSLGDVKAAAVHAGDTYANHQTMALISNPNYSSNAVTSYSLDFSPAQDWSGYSHLLLRACADADAANFDLATLPAPDFTLALSDSSPNPVRIRPKALDEPDRFRSPVANQKVWTQMGTTYQRDCTVIRLETVPVLLGEFTGLDLTSITKISIEIPGNTSRRLFFDSLELVKM